MGTPNTTEREDCSTNIRILRTVNCTNMESIKFKNAENQKVSAASSHLSGKKIKTKWGRTNTTTGHDEDK